MDPFVVPIMVLNSSIDAECNGLMQYTIAYSFTLPYFKTAFAMLYGRFFFCGGWKLKPSHIEAVYTLSTPLFLHRFLWQLWDSDIWFHFLASSALLWWHLIGFFSCDLDLWSMPLPFKLHLGILPLDLHAKKLNLYICPFGCKSEKDTHTDRQNDDAKTITNWLPTFYSYIYMYFYIFMLSVYTYIIPNTIYSKRPMTLPLFPQPKRHFWDSGRIQKSPENASWECSI